MIAQFRTLHKVKVTREDIVLRALQAKRLELAEAEDTRQECETVVAESSDTLRERENAIFDAIIQKIVTTDEIDTVKENIQQIYKDHQQLEDELEMSIQHCARLTRELEDTQEQFQLAQRSREKFDSLLGDLVRDQAALGEKVEEAEVEDVYAKRRPQLA